MAEEYENGWAVTHVFPINSVGIVTARDKLTIRWTPNEMKQVATTFAELSEDDARMRYDLRRDVRDWKVRWAQQDVAEHSKAEDHVVPVLYRPFDKRYTYYTGHSRGFICMPRQKVMRHMLAGPNVGIVTTRQCQQDWSAMVSKTIIGHKALTAYDINSLFPLYTYPTDAEEGFSLAREPNLSHDFTGAAAASIGLDFISTGPGDLETTFGPEDVFHYIYSVLHSPEYRRRYADFLKSDFPRVPLTGDRSLFATLVKLGERLASLHLMEREGDDVPAFPVMGSDVRGQGAIRGSGRGHPRAGVHKRRPVF